MPTARFRQATCCREIRPPASLAAVHAPQGAMLLPRRRKELLGRAVLIFSPRQRVAGLQHIELTMVSQR